MQIGKYELKGGGCCPEQYDVFHDGKEVAYLRMRHGCFTADLTVNGQITETVYEDESPDGDGCFTYFERDRYLKAAIEAIDKKLHAKWPNVIGEPRHDRRGKTKRTPQWRCALAPG